MTKKVLYGRSNGPVPASVMSVSIDENQSVNLFIDNENLKKLDVKVPDNAEIEIRVRYRMRFQRFKCGTLKDRESKPICTVSKSDKLTIVSANTVEHAKLEVCILNPSQKGHRLAWHEKGRMQEGDTVVEDASGQSLLQIEVVDFVDVDLKKPNKKELKVDANAIAFRLDFRDTYPVVQINSNHAALKQEFKRPGSPLANIVVPSCLEMILHRLVQDHLCEDVQDLSKSKWQKKWLVWLDSHKFVLPDRPDSMEEIPRYFEATRLMIEQVLNFINTRVRQAESYKTILTNLKE